MTDWTTLDVERLADALTDIYVERGFFYEFGEKAREWAGMTAREDARELLGLVADKLDVERLARAVDAVYPNPYSAVMAGQIAGEYDVDEQSRVVAWAREPGVREMLMADAHLAARQERDVG